MTRADFPESARLVLGAELARHKPGAHAVGAAMQKAVLWVIWAYEGRPVSYAAFEARAGASHAAAHRAILALVIQGIITEADAGGCKSRSYTINYEKLKTIQTDTPLFGVGSVGNAKRERPVFNGQVLPVPGWTWTDKGAVKKRRTA